ENLNFLLFNAQDVKTIELLEKYTLFFRTLHENFNAQILAEKTIWNINQNLFTKLLEKFNTEKNHSHQDIDLMKLGLMSLLFKQIDDCQRSNNSSSQEVVLTNFQSLIASEILKNPSLKNLQKITYLLQRISNLTAISFAAPIFQNQLQTIKQNIFDALIVYYEGNIRENQTGKPMRNIGMLLQLLDQDKKDINNLKKTPGVDQPLLYERLIHIILLEELVFEYQKVAVNLEQYTKNQEIKTHRKAAINAIRNKDNDKLQKSIIALKRIVGDITWEILLDDGESLIEIAGSDRNIEAIKVLVERGTNVNAVNGDKKTLLDISLEKPADYKMALFLIGAGGISSLESGIAKELQSFLMDPKNLKIVESADLRKKIADKFKSLKLQPTEWMNVLKEFKEGLNLNKQLNKPSQEAVSQSATTQTKKASSKKKNPKRKQAGAEKKRVDPNLETRELTALEAAVPIILPIEEGQKTKGDLQKDQTEEEGFLVTPDSSVQEEELMAPEDKNLGGQKTINSKKSAPTPHDLAAEYSSPEENTLPVKPAERSNLFDRYVDFYRLTMDQKSSLDEVRANFTNGLLVDADFFELTEEYSTDEEDLAKEAKKNSNNTPLVGNKLGELPDADFPRKNFTNIKELQEFLKKELEEKPEPSEKKEDLQSSQDSDSSSLLSNVMTLEERELKLKDFALFLHYQDFENNPENRKKLIIELEIFLKPHSEVERLDEELFYLEVEDIAEEVLNLLSQIRSHTNPIVEIPIGEIMSKNKELFIKIPYSKEGKFTSPEKGTLVPVLKLDNRVTGEKETYAIIPDIGPRKIVKNAARNTILLTNDDIKFLRAPGNNISSASANIVVQSAKNLISHSG
ncbi:MAG: hypothetical protein ACI9TO_001391, partial [Rickettsiales bacterium]